MAVFPKTAVDGNFPIHKIADLKVIHIVFIYWEYIVLLGNRDAN